MHFSVRNAFSSFHIYNYIWLLRIFLATRKWQTYLLDIRSFKIYAFAFLKKIYCLYDNRISKMRKIFNKEISLMFLLLILIVLALYEHISKFQWISELFLLIKQKKKNLYGTQPCKTIKACVFCPNLEGPGAHIVLGQCSASHRSYGLLLR